MSAPRFDSIEEQHDEDPSGWGSLLLDAAFDGLEAEAVDRESYGRMIEVRIEGVTLEVQLGFQGPGPTGSAS